MAGKPHVNIDCSFFDDLINGHLRPFLPIYDQWDEVKKLNSIILDSKLNDEELDLWFTKGIFPKEILKKFNITDGDIFEFYQTSDNEFSILLSKPENFLEPLIDIDIPPTIDDKSEAFLNLIEREFDNMEVKAKEVLKASINDQQLAFYANKNIQSLKHIAQQAGKLYKQLLDSGKDPSNDSNTYIIHIVKIFLIRAIMFYQESFEPFLKEVPEDYYNLKVILFGDKHPDDITKQLEAKFKSLNYKNISDIFDYINSGILQVELFIKGSIKEIQFHNILGAFEKLFQEIIKIENFTESNISLIYQYNNILYDITYNDDDGEYEDNIDIENKVFRRMIRQISNSFDLTGKFLNKHNLNPVQDSQKFSILDIILNKEEKKENPEHIESKSIPDSSIPPIKKDDYFKFLELFKYNYSYEYCTISFIHTVKEYSDYLKKEILSNFINLNPDKKLDYLEWLKFDIEKLKENVWSTKERLDKWYKKYNVPEDFVWSRNYHSNELYGFLQSDRATFKETQEVDYNPDKEASMDDFYNYYYGLGVDDMLTFINFQISKLKPGLNTSTHIVPPSISSGNELSSFKLAFNDFLELANISLKYKSHWSCSGFYEALNDAFLNVKAEIQSQFISVPANDREVFIDAHLQKIYNITKNYPAGPIGKADGYIKKLNTTVVKLFNILVFDDYGDLNKLPACLRLNFDDFTNMIHDPEIYEIRVSFFFFLSDLFIEKLIAFFHDLTTSEKIEITKSDIPITIPSKTKYPSFKIKNFNKRQSSITVLLNHLKDNEFVPKNTEISEFKKIFKGELPKKPIVWSGYKGDLFYFIKSLKENNSLFDYMPYQVWQVASKLFVDIEGKEILSGDSKSLKSTKKADFIDSAIDLLR